MDNALSNHVTCLLTFLLDMQMKIENFLSEKNDRSTISVQAEELQVAFEAFKSQYDHVIKRVESLEHQLSDEIVSTKGAASASFLGDTKFAENKGETTLHKSSKYLILPPEDTAKSSSLSNEQTRQISNMESKICDYESSLEELEKKFGDQERAMDALKDWNCRLEGKINSLKHELALKEMTMVEQHEKLDAMEQSSYGGVLIWPINGFMKKRHDAIIGKTVSLYSPVFYTGHHGYKLRVRIYLNGDGLGKGTHISLFFVVCKGRYDALLSWPFRQKVTMMILDQDNIEHVVDSFRPDPHSSSFQKPKNEMNVASGCPFFMPLAHLDTRSYVRDDKMFVMVKVEPKVAEETSSAVKDASASLPSSTDNTRTRNSVDIFRRDPEDQVDKTLNLLDVLNKVDQLEQKIDAFEEQGGIKMSSKLMSLPLYQC